MALYNFDTLKIFQSYPPNIHNYKDGDLAIIKETKEVFEFSKNKWKQKKSGVKVSLLELNKSIINQLPNYTEEQIKELKFSIQKLKARQPAKYYLLINYDLHYLTVLAEVKELHEERFEDIVIECLQNRGQIKTIEELHDHIEIWIKNQADIEVLFLMPYDQAVEEY